MLRCFVLTVAGLASAATARDRPIELARLCADEQPQRVAGRDGAQLKRLDRLPKAEAYIAVLRRENGCTRPQRVQEYREQALRGR
jgi:hypothetical protein